MAQVRKPDRAAFRENPAVAAMCETAGLIRDATDAPRKGFAAALEATALWLVAPALLAAGFAGVGRPLGLSDTAVLVIGGLVLPLALSVPLIRGESARRRARLARIRMDFPE